MPTIYGVALSGTEPTSGVTVKLSDPNGDEKGTLTTSEDGIFKFEVLPGTWKLDWSAADGSTDEGEIEVVEGEDAEVEIVV